MFITFVYLIFNSVSIIYLGFGKTNNKALIILFFMLYEIYSAATDGIQKSLILDLIDKNKMRTGRGIYINYLLG